MAEFDSFDVAAEALAAAVGGESGTPEVSADATQVSPTNQPASDVAQGDPQSDFIPSKEINLDELPPEAKLYIQAREREMQAGFTQKTQALAEERRQAQQAIQFIEALNSDPNFALQVRDRISQELQQAGYDVATANAMAAQEVPGPEANEWDSEYEDDPYLSRIKELEGKLSSFQEQQEVAEWNARMDRMLAVIQTENPNWGDDELSAVVALGYATNGDLLRAADLLKKQNERTIERYLAEKSTVRTPAPISNSQGQPVPEPFKDLYDTRLEEAALQRIREAGLLDN